MALSWGSGISLIGPKGQPGVSVLTGAGSPTSTNVTGVENQSYIDTQNGVLYQYTSGAWNAGQSLKGPMGINGVSGAFFTGVGAPTSATNASNPTANAIYIQTTGEVWTYTQSGGWVDSGETLVGPQGLMGVRGSYTTSGTALPTTTNPANSLKNDRYIVQSTGEVYSFDGSAWNDLGYSIMGPQGPVGRRGSITTSGTSIPTTSNPSGSLTGDRYILQATGEVYSFDGSNWNDLGYSMIGPPGAKGDTGASGQRGTQSYSGQAAPTSSNPAGAQAGDFYFQVNAAGTAIQLYQLTGS